jgi:hypothetical protein
MSVTKRQQDAGELFPSDKRHQASIMVNRTVFLVTIFLLFAPNICRADMATALNEISLLFLVLIVPII